MRTSLTEVAKMQDQNGFAHHRRPTATCAPLSRSKVEAMLLLDHPSKVTELTKDWLALDDDLTRLEKQAQHVRTVLSDKLLGNMLDERTRDLTATMRRRAGELCELPAQNMTDIECKLLVRARLLDIAPADKEIAGKLKDSLQDDCKRLAPDSGMPPSASKAH